MRRATCSQRAEIRAALKTTRMPEYLRVVSTRLDHQFAVDGTMPFLAGRTELRTLHRKSCAANVIARKESGILPTVLSRRPGKAQRFEINGGIGRYHSQLRFAILGRE